MINYSATSLVFFDVVELLVLGLIINHQESVSLIDGLVNSFLLFIVYFWWGGGRVFSCYIG